MALDVAPRAQRIGHALFPLGLVFLAVGISTSVVSPFLSLFLNTAVHANALQVTLFLVASPLAGVTASTVLGRLSDRRAIRRRLLIGASLSGMVGSALTAVVRDYWLLLALAVTATALATTLFPQTFAYARQILTRDHPAKATMGISTLRTVFSTAWVAGPSLASFLLSRGGFGYVYGTAAVTYGVAALIAFVWLDEIDVPATLVPASEGVPLPAERGPSQGPDPGNPTPSRWTLFRTAAAFTALSCPMTLGVQALPMFISTDLGGDVSDSGLLLGICAGLEIPLILGFGALTSWIQLRSLVLAGAACGVAYYALAATTSSLWILAGGQIVNATFIAAVTGLGISYVQDMLPHSPGQATTLFTNTFPIGSILAGPLLGIAQQFDFRLAYGMSAVLCATGLVVLAVTRPPAASATPATTATH